MASVLANSNYKLIYDSNLLNDLGNIATKQVAAFQNSNATPNNLIIGASSNVSFESVTGMRVIFNSNETVKFRNFDIGVQSNFDILTISKSNGMGILSGSNALKLSGESGTYLSSTTIIDSNNSQILSTTLSNFVIQNSIVLSSNQESETHTFTPSFSLYKDTEPNISNSNMTQIAYGLYINDYDQLQIVQFKKYGTSNTSSELKNIQVFGTPETKANQYISSYYKFTAMHSFNNMAPLLMKYSYVNEIGLDQNIAHLYSTKKLLLTYEGPIIRVRNSLNSQEASVYINANGIITQIQTFNNSSDNIVRSTLTGSNSLSDWLAGGVPYTTIWYDQTGKSNLYSSTPSVQPKYDMGSNMVDFNAGSGHTMYYPSSWTINDMTFVIDMVPTNVSVASNAGWYFQQNIIYGERPGETYDWGIPMASPAQFGLATGPWDAKYFINTNGINARSVMSIARNSTTGIVSLYKDGSNMSTVTLNSGTLSAPNPTRLAYGINGSLGAKFNSIIHYNTRLSDGSVKLMSDFTYGYEIKLS